MKNTKELIKSFTKEDYKNGVNLHVHTNCSDGKTDVQEIIKEAKEKHYKYIAITDHNTINAYKIAPIENEDFIITGIEFDCWYKLIFFHLLAYGIDVNHPDIQPFLAKTKVETEVNVIRLLSRRDLRKLFKAIHNAGGIAVLAHPACYWCINLDRFVKKLITFGLDGIETYYPYNRLRGIIKFHSRKTVEKIANKYNLIKTGGTDCHTVLSDIKLD